MLVEGNLFDPPWFQKNETCSLEIYKENSSFILCFILFFIASSRNYRFKGRTKILIWMSLLLKFLRLRLNVWLMALGSVKLYWCSPWWGTVFFGVERSWLMENMSDIFYVLTQVVLGRFVVANFQFSYFLILITLS